MKTKIKHVLSVAISLLFLASLIFGALHWRNRPMPVPLDDPSAQPIKDVLVKSHEIEEALACVPDANINLLDSVFVDTTDYRPDKNSRILIADYLGKDAVKEAGFLTYMKAYHLWRKSGDPHPGLPSPVTSNPSIPITPEPVFYCPDTAPIIELHYTSIAIKEDRAIIEYSYMLYGFRAVLTRRDGTWFIANREILWVSP